MKSFDSRVLASAVSGVVLCAVLAPALTAHAQTTAIIPLCEIQRGLTIGSQGEDVRCLQRYLNWAGYPVSTSGAGSPGQETMYFGELTASAVARWQDVHASQVLVPLALSSGTGYWGASSFAHYVQLVRSALGV